MIGTPDREEITTAARRFFDAGLCCAVEVQGDGPAEADVTAWESRVLVFRSGTPDDVLDAAEETIALAPGHRVRVRGYSSAALLPVAGSPAPVMCSPVLVAAA